MLARRLRSISLVIVLLPAMVLTLPLWLPIVCAIDLLSGRRRLPMARIGLMAIAYLANQWWGLSVVAWLTATGRGRSATHHRDLQRRWVESLLRAGRPLLGVEFDLRGPELPAGRVVMLSRHASMVDALVPVLLVEGRHQRPVHYALKAELRNDPCLDIVGHRLDNWFVQRGNDTEREVAGLRALATRSSDDAAMAIFPEGTYATPGTRVRVQASLDEKGPADAAALGRELQRLLPPKPAGVDALLDTATDADVVFIGHTGLEGVAEARGLLATIPLRAPIVVDGWVVPRGEVPDGSQRVEWLHDQWRRLDRWVIDTANERETQH